MCDIVTKISLSWVLFMSVLNRKRRFDSKKPLKKAFLGLVFAFFALLSLSTPLLTSLSASAITFDPAKTQETPSDSTPSGSTPSDTETPSGSNPTSSDSDSNSSSSSEDNCYSQTGAIGWLVCPSTGVLTKAVDGIYSVIAKFLSIKPLLSDVSSPIYQVWSYVRNITNIVFIVFILVIILSQLSGVGISNYGIKRTLPKIIIAAILVNLSWIICVLAVDLSNILGSSLRSFFSNIEESTVASGLLASTPDAIKLNWGDLAGLIISGGAIAGFTIGLSGGLASLLWPLILMVISAFISVCIALVTVAARQALVYLLIMISPLAFVCYLLPNTENWYKKWKNMLFQMLIFYPAFSVLFGASSLASWVLIASAEDAMMLILGLAVKVVPLFMAWQMLKMSGTIPGQISAALTKASAKPLASAREYTSERRNIARAEYTARNMKRRFNPLHGGSLSAKMIGNKARRADRLATAQRRVKALTAEQVVASKDNRRIIGYDEKGRPIYATARKPFLGIRNSDMKQEFLTREDELRLRASTDRMNNHMNSMATYLDK